MKNNYEYEGKDADMIMACLKQICQYVENLMLTIHVSQVGNTIHLTSQAYKDKISSVKGADLILQGFNFYPDLQCSKLVLSHFNEDLFTEGIDLLNAELD